jgi:hypothetical protein
VETDNTHLLYEREKTRSRRVNVASKLGVHRFLNHYIHVPSPLKCTWRYILFDTELNLHKLRASKPEYINTKRIGILTRRIEAFEEDNAADSHLQKFHNRLCYMT